MKNSDYWAQRFVLMNNALQNKSYDYVKNIEKQYNSAIADIDKQMRAWYQRFANNNSVSYADAQKMLTVGQLREFKWTVEEYIAKAQENELTGTWVKELENASARVHISRLEALKLQLRQQAEVLTNSRAVITHDAAQQAYIEGYYRTAYEVQRGLGYGWSMQALNTDALEKVLSRPWTVDNRTFRARCWTDKTKLVQTVNNELTQMLATGAPPDKAIEAIVKQFNVSKYNAGRLIMTESAHFAVLAQRDGFKALDVEEYQVVETFDKYTCSTCGGMDGKHFPMSDFAAGANAPPFHPWCRGCVAPYFADMEGVGQRYSRDPESEKREMLPANTKFSDWRERYVKDLTNGARNDIMKTGRIKGNHSQQPPDFSKYHVLDDPESVSKLKTFISSELNVSEVQIKLDGLKNIKVAKPFFDRLGKIRKECGLNISGIISSDMIDGDVCCIACYKPFENTLYVSNRYFNSQEALLDTLKTWANNGIIPKQCTTIQFIAEHEAAHIRIPDELLKSDEARKIFKKRILENQNDKDIFEYYADAVAIFRTDKNISDKNLNQAIEYLRKAGVKV